METFEEIIKKITDEQLIFYLVTEKKELNIKYKNVKSIEQEMERRFNEKKQGG